MNNVKINNGTVHTQAMVKQGCQTCKHHSKLDKLYSYNSFHGKYVRDNICDYLWDKISGHWCISITSFVTTLFVFICIYFSFIIITNFMFWRSSSIRSFHCLKNIFSQLFLQSLQLLFTCRFQLSADPLWKMSLLIIICINNFMSVKFVDIKNFMPLWNLMPVCQTCTKFRPVQDLYYTKTSFISPMIM